MTLSEKLKHGSPYHNRTDIDPASDRPMSVSDIGELYAERADWMHRLEWRANAHYAKNGYRWTQVPREIVSAAGIGVQDTRTVLLGTATTFELPSNPGDER